MDLTVIPYKWNCSRWFVFILVKAQIWFPPVPKQTDFGSDLFLVETKWKMFSAEHKPRHGEACSSASTTFMYFTHADQRRCGWQSMGPGFSVIRADERWGRFPALVMAAGVGVDLAAGGLKRYIWGAWGSTSMSNLLYQKAFFSINTAFIRGAQCCAARTVSALPLGRCHVWDRLMAAQLESVWSAALLTWENLVQINTRACSVFLRSLLNMQERNFFLTDACKRM